MNARLFSFVVGLTMVSTAWAQQLLVSIKASRPETTEPSPTTRVMPGEFLITREGGTLDELTVYLAYRGTATPGVDYAELPMKVAIPAGAISQTLLVEPFDDTEAEGDETVVAMLQMVPGAPLPDSSAGGYVISTGGSQARVVIHDNDSTVVGIEATRRIAEETSWPLRRLRFDGLFTISRKGPTQNSLPVYVTYSGSSTPGQDTPLLPWMVTIPAGASSVEIPVEAVVDETPEPIETLVATISNCPPEPLKPPCYDFEIDPARSQATVFLRDDGITRASLDLVGPEQGAQFEVGQSIGLEAVAIDLESYISRIEFWADDTLIGVSEIVFIRAPDPGTPIQHSFQWNDAAPGPHLLTARATLEDGLRLSSAPVRIWVHAPDLLPTLAVTAPDPFALEPTPDTEPNPAWFRIIRLGSTTAALEVRYTLGGTAENGVDYEELPGTTTIPAGEDSATIAVRPLPDKAIEGFETVALRLVESDAYRIAPRHGRARIVISEHRPPHLGPRCVAIRDGSRYLWFLAEAGRRFRIEASTNLRIWETVFTGDATEGAVHFVDDDAETRPCRFYRLVPE